MKRTITTCTAVLVVACAAAWAAYSIGYRRGFDQALVLQNGTFISTLDAMQKIRTNDVGGGTRSIERLCFSAANVVYGDRPAGKVVAGQFLDEFKRYRQTYRSNTSEWTVAEQVLEKKLAKR